MTDDMRTKVISKIIEKNKSISERDMKIVDMVIEEMNNKDIDKKKGFLAKI